jgi:seryl-tRNA synthetase
MFDQPAIERLETLVEMDKKASKTQSELDRTKLYLREIKAELKTLKAIGPERLKKNVADLKKKMVVKNSEIKAQGKELNTIRSSLREAKSKLNASRNEIDAFYVSPCKRWELSFTGFRFASERTDVNSVRIRCLDRETGTSVMVNAVDGDKVVWSSNIGVSDVMSEKAALYFKGETGASQDRAMD